MDLESGREPGEGLSRRSLLRTATASGVAVTTAAALAAVPGAQAELAPGGSYGAPLVEIHVPAALLSPEQKSAMIKGVTDVIVAATGLPAERQRYLWVQIFETAVGGWGVGGHVFVSRDQQQPAQKQ